MPPVNLSRLAKALWSCQPYEAYLNALVEAAMAKFSDPADDFIVIANELQDVVWVVTHVKNLTQAKAVDLKAHEFLAAISSFKAGPPATDTSTPADGGFVEDTTVAKAVQYTRGDLAAMKMSALKDLLVEKNLPAGGNKSDMIERLLDPFAVSVGDESDDINQMDQLQGMTVAQLKEILAAKGLKVSGRKQELVDRLLCEQELPDCSPGIETGVHPTSAGGGAQLSSASTGSEEAVSVEDDRGSETALAELTVAELKSLLRDNGLKVGGKKSELVERCMANGVKG